MADSRYILFMKTHTNETGIEMANAATLLVATERLKRYGHEL